MIGPIQIETTMSLKAMIEGKSVPIVEVQVIKQLDNCFIVTDIKRTATLLLPADSAFSKDICAPGRVIKLLKPKLLDPNTVQQNSLFKLIPGKSFEVDLEKLASRIKTLEKLAPSCPPLEDPQGPTLSLNQVEDLFAKGKTFVKPPVPLLILKISRLIETEKGPYCIATVKDKLGSRVG